MHLNIRWIFRFFKVLEFIQDSSNLIQFLWADYKIKEYIETHTDAPIENVIIEISNNGGGDVKSLVEILGFVSDNEVAKLSWLKIQMMILLTVVKVDTNFDVVYD